MWAEKTIIGAQTYKVCARRGWDRIELEGEKINYKINFSKEERSSKSVSCRSQVDFHEIETSESMRLKNLFRDGDLRHLFHQNPGDQSRRVTEGLLSCQNSDGLKAAEKNKKECRALLGIIKSSLGDQLWSVRGGTA